MGPAVQETPPVSIKVFVATPTYNNKLDLGYIKSMFNIQQSQKNYNVKFNFISGSLINRCRNELLALLASSIVPMLILSSNGLF